MGAEPTGGDPRRDNTATVRPGQVVRSNPLAQWSHEIRLEGDRLLVTVECPELDADSLRYAVGRRYVVVWSALGPRTFQHVVLLSEAVDAKDHVVSLRNGVLDVSVRRLRDA